MQIIKLFILTILFVLSFAVLFGVGVFVYFAQDLPQIVTIEDYKPKLKTSIYDINNIKIGEFYREYRELVSYEEIPEVIIQAFIASEDAHFFEHKGIDFGGVLRAVIANLKVGHFAQGASTITQQVAKTLLLSSEKKLSRKIKEAILASRIEQNLTKSDILYLYLNQIYLGHGSYGVKAAAKLYFNKDLQDVTLAEAALLAGLPQAPSRWSPYSNQKQAKKRQLYVLARMVEDGYVTGKDAELAANQTLKLYKTEAQNMKIAPFFIETVRRYLVYKFGQKAVLDDGLQVYTSLNSEYQKIANKSLQKRLKELDKRQGFTRPITHFNNKTEISNFLQKYREELLEKEKDYIFFPKSNTDIALSVKGFKYVSKKTKDQTSNLKLKKNTMYKAVILSLNKGKSLKVSVAGEEGVIPWKGLSWAHPRDLNPRQYAPKLRTVNQIVQKGDLVFVQYLEKGLFSLDQEPKVEGALLSIDVKTGKLRTMCGGYSYLKNQFNRTYQSHRQAGSTFKPIIYSGAIDKGYTVSSIIVDSPIVYQGTEDEQAWKPHNYSQKYYGDTTLRNALVHSRNIPTTKILQDISVPYAVSYARKLGIHSPMQMDLSIGLGSAAVTIWEMVKVFSLFPAQGKRVIPNFINKVKNRYGELVYENNLTKLKDPISELENIENNEKWGEKVIPEETAYIMTHLLRDVVLHGTGFKVSKLPYPVAGKTGTSNNFIDAWFMGFSSKTVTGVWVGFDDSGKSLGRNETGAKAALPIWKDYMEFVIGHEKPTTFKQPDNINMVKVDLKTGLTIQNKQMGQIPIFQPFKIGTEPKTSTQDKMDNFDTTEFLKEDF